MSAIGHCQVNAIEARAEQLALFDVPILGLYPLALDEANALLVAWKHRLGAPQEAPARP